jgi:hypothetical protein
MGRIRGEFSCRSSKKKGCHIRTCEYMSLDAQKSATTLAAAFTKKKNWSRLKTQMFLSIEPMSRLIFFQHFTSHKNDFPCGKGPKDYSNPGWL